MEQNDRKVYLRHLVASPAGQAHLLTEAVMAEEGDELGIFDLVADALDETRLAEVVRRHKDDETRHAQLFRSCLDRLGLELQVLPDELGIISQLVHHVDGFEIGVHSPAALTGTYALLYAVEERGVEQFPLIAEAFRPVDPDTADTYLEVARDEQRHLKYCNSVGRHFAPDAATWQRSIDEARRIEQATFDQFLSNDQAYTTGQGLLLEAA